MATDRDKHLANVRANMTRGEHNTVPMTDNTQSDVVEVRPCMDATGERRVSWDICQKAEPDAIGVGVIASCYGTYEQACIMAASLSTKDALSPRERLASKVGVAIANRANLGDEPPVSTKSDVVATIASAIPCVHITDENMRQALAQDIAAALRSDRDAVVEECARAVEGEYADDDDTESTAFNQGVSAALDAIRNLKGDR